MATALDDSTVPEISVKIGVKYLRAKPGSVESSALPLSVWVSAETLLSSVVLLWPLLSGHSAHKCTCNYVLFLLRVLIITTLLLLIASIYRVFMWARYCARHNSMEFPNKRFLFPLLHLF